MNAQVKLLIELQEMDKAIIEKNSLIEQAPLRIQAGERSFRGARDLMESARKEHDALLKQKKDMDSELELMNQKISKLKSRTSEIKTNKEYQAHLKEIESAEKEKFRYEDGILGLMEKIEASDRNMKASAAGAKEEEARAEAVRKKLEAESEEARKELSVLMQKRADFAGKIEPGVYELYMNLLEKHGGIAVARVSNEICGGCNMKVMPQLFVQVKETDEILQCPQCDRILYYEEEAAEEAAQLKKERA